MFKNAYTRRSNIIYVFFLFVFSINFWQSKRNEEKVKAEFPPHTFTTLNATYKTSLTT